MMNRLLKLLDLIAFTTMGVFAYTFYNAYATSGEMAHALKFDGVIFTALLYVMVRRPDVNTITLAMICMIGRVIDVLLLNYNIEQLGGFVHYPLLMVINLAALAATWTRPVLFSKIWPWKNNPHFAVTHQDNALGIVFSFQALFMFLLLVEHTLRRINDWMMENFLFLYNILPFVQFLSTIVVFGILFYMTFDASKIKRSDRQKFRVQDGLQ
jgi:hypothetical protein